MMFPVLMHGGLYALSGMVIGLLSGLFGIGGGILIVPVLLMMFEKNPDMVHMPNMHLAIGTSLAIMIFTSFSAILSHYTHRKISVDIYKRLSIGLILGTLSGSVTAFFISGESLNLLLVFFLCVVILKMIIDRKSVHPERFPHPIVNMLVAFSISFFAGLLGIGGGVLLLPYLTYCGVDTRKIAGILALCTMTVAMTGTIVFIVSGSFAPILPTWSTGYVYWLPVLFMAIPSSIFAIIGARLSYILPVKQLKYGFIFLLIITAIDLLPGGIFVSFS